VSFYVETYPTQNTANSLWIYVLKTVDRKWEICEREAAHEIGSPNLKKEMKAKSLILAAAIGVASAIPATAQNTVFSVNAVGFVNKTVSDGFTLIANPLIAENNTLAGLFGTTLPSGTQIFKFDPNQGFISSQFFDLGGGTTLWVPGGAEATTVVPGEGFFINIPGGTGNHTITFVGNVPQGTLDTPLSQGFQLISSQVPQAGEIVSDLGLPIGNQDQIFKFNKSSGFISIQFFDLGGGTTLWVNSEFGGQNIPPSVDVGEGFFLNRQAAGSATWSRNFDVNSQ
tara:strand:+ start:2886 stop:3737 length:852 start_codon:yes stop_codon:yes gene_type:complete